MYALKLLHLDAFMLLNCYDIAPILRTYAVTLWRCNALAWYYTLTQLRS